MAEKKNEEVKKNETVEPKVTGVPGLAIGRIVHYFKEVQTNSGSQLKTYAAIIADHAKGNFQPKDGAVDLTVFITQGGSVDSKFGVMYSDVPAAGRWSFPPKV